MLNKSEYDTAEIVIEMCQYYLGNRHQICASQDEIIEVLEEMKAKKQSSKIHHYSCYAITSDNTSSESP